MLAQRSVPLFGGDDTGFVLLALVTSPTLLVEHPRLELKRFDDLEAARAALSTFGVPAIAEASWA